MNNTSDANPYLIFFQHQPQNLVEQPPLASSLQTFETSLLLISIGRFPHALVSCVSAIESAIKADQGYPQNPPHEEQKSLVDLLNTSNQKLNVDIGFKNLIHKARCLRNDIAHWGFSPKDDAICADLLLRVAYPYLFACYDQFFQLALLKEPIHEIKFLNFSDGFLRPEIHEHLKIALRVFERVKHIENINLSYCFLALVHQIILIIQPTYLSDWQWKVLESAEEGMQPFEIKERLKEKQRNRFPFVWDQFVCPICGYNDFVCDLKDSDRIEISEGICVNCNFKVSADCTYLLDELLSEQIILQKDEINKRYPRVNQS